MRSKVRRIEFLDLIHIKIAFPTCSIFKVLAASVLVTASIYYHKPFSLSTIFRRFSQLFYKFPKRLPRALHIVVVLAEKPTEQGVLPVTASL